MSASVIPNVSATTLRFTVTPAAYTNVDDGSPNVSLMVETGRGVRVVVGGSSAPVPDTSDHINVRPFGSSSPALTMSVTDLAPEDGVWVRGDQGDVVVTVVRGSSKLLVSEA